MRQGMYESHSIGNLTVSDWDGSIRLPLLKEFVACVGVRTHTNRPEKPGCLELPQRT